MIETDGPLRRVLYSVALLLIIIPLYQTVLQIWPLKLGNIQWRFAAANILSGVLILPFIGLSILLWMSRVLESRTLSTVVGVVTGISCALLAAGVVVFVLDGLQLKGIVNTAQTNAFNTTVVRTIGVVLMFVIGFALVTLAAFRRPRGRLEPVRKGVRVPADEGVGLIVGQPYAKAE